MTKFRKADRGIAAIEMAFVLPLMLLLYFAMLDARSACHAQEQRPVAPLQPRAGPIDEQLVDVMIGHRRPDGVNMRGHAVGTLGIGD
jgi:hypothetical protein